MNNFLATQESVLPLGYRLQVTYDEKGCPATVPVGTSRLGQLEMQYDALVLREKIARELEHLFVTEFGYTWGDYRIMCTNDPDGNEGVWLRAKIPPSKHIDHAIKAPEPVAQIKENASDIIDV